MNWLPGFRFTKIHEVSYLRIAKNYFESADLASQRGVIVAGFAIVEGNTGAPQNDAARNYNYDDFWSFTGFTQGDTRRGVLPFLCEFLTEDSQEPRLHRSLDSGKEDIINTAAWALGLDYNTLLMRADWMQVIKDALKK
jgi:hypothetical protein